MKFFLALSFAEQVMFGLVVLLGLAAGWRNLTATALCVCYGVVMGVWWRYGVTFPVHVSLTFDYLVIIAIYCKAPVNLGLNYEPRHLLRSLWLERSYWDRCVIALFPIAWSTYVIPYGESLAWWILWTVALTQYLAAGGETLQAFQSSRTAKRAAASEDETVPGSKFMTGWKSWSYG